MKNLNLTRMAAVLVMAVVTAWGGAFYVQASQGTPPDSGGSWQYADEGTYKRAPERENDRCCLFKELGQRCRYNQNAGCLSLRWRNLECPLPYGHTCCFRGLQLNLWPTTAVFLDQSKEPLHTFVLGEDLDFLGKARRICRMIRKEVRHG